MASDLFDLSGKVALITGANAGIGLGYAHAIARAGGDVAIWGRRADRNDAARAELSAHGGRVFADAVDVADERQVVDGFGRALAELGRIDCVIANAGFVSQAPFAEMTTQQYDELVKVAQYGAFFTLREGARHMLARAGAGDPGGSLIATGSLSIFQAVPGLVHYGSAKSAVAVMIRNLAVEYARHGIRANMICAGTVESEMMPEESAVLLRSIAERTPIPRLGTPSDLDGIVVYLMSDASAWHTGDLITVDGGWMASLF